MERLDSAQLLGGIAEGLNGDAAPVERLQPAYLAPEQAANIYRLALAQIEAKALEAWINLQLEPGSAARRAVYEELIAQRAVIERDGAPWL